MTLEEIKQIAKAAYDNKVAEFIKAFKEKHPDEEPFVRPYFASWVEVIRLPLAVLYNVDSTVSVIDGDFGRVAKITYKSVAVHIPLHMDSKDINTTADNCEIVILAKYNNVDDTVDFVRRVNILK